MLIVLSIYALVIRCPVLTILRVTQNCALLNCDTEWLASGGSFFLTRCGNLRFNSAYCGNYHHPSDKKIGGYQVNRKQRELHILFLQWNGDEFLP